MALFSACSGGERGTVREAHPPTTAGTPTTNLQAFNREQIERFVLDTQRTGTPDLRVARASCPETLHLAVGSRFECTVEVEGVKAPYNVSLPSPGVIEAVPARAIISTASAVAFVKSNLPPEVGAKVEVDCGRAAVRVVDVGATFPCSISDGRSTQTVNVLAQDSKGAVSLQL